MSSDLFPRTTQKFEIEIYKRPKNIKELVNTHVSFSGSPQRHPHDPEKVVLVTDPYSSNAFYYEFKTEDISYLEELPHLVNLDGKAISMVRIWVKKMRIGLRCTPFVVEDTRPDPG